AAGRDRDARRQARRSSARPAWTCPRRAGRITRSRRVASPAAGVRHRLPWLARFQRLALLQELDGNAVRGADEGHAAVAGRTIDGDTRVHELFEIGRAHGTPVTCKSRM